MEVPNAPCAALANDTDWKNKLSQPSLQGNPRSGQTMRAYLGMWPSALSFCTYWIMDKKVISGTAGSSFRLQNEDIGKAIQFVVVGSDKAGTAKLRYSDPIKVQNAKFSNTVEPQIRGFANVGRRLKATTQLWSVGTTYSYQWFRNGVAIQSATSSTYFPVVQDLGAVLTVVACGSKQFVDTQCLESTGLQIGVGSISVSGSATIRGSGRAGATLLGIPPTFMDGADVKYQWLLDGEPIINETSNVHTILKSESGHILSFEVTATKYGYQQIVRTSRSKKLP
jgi:hypothetical protein